MWHCRTMRLGAVGMTRLGASRISVQASRDWKWYITGSPRVVPGLGNEPVLNLHFELCPATGL